MDVKPIMWTQNATVNIDVSSSSQSIDLAGAINGYRQIEIFNNGSATVWVAFGDSTITTALTTGKPVAAGADLVVTIGPGTTHAAAIAAGSTGKIYFTPGSGL